MWWCVSCEFTCTVYYTFFSAKYEFRQELYPAGITRGRNQWNMKGTRQLENCCPLTGKRTIPYLFPYPLEMTIAWPIYLTTFAVLTWNAPYSVANNIPLMVIPLGGCEKLLSYVIPQKEGMFREDRIKKLSEKWAKYIWKQKWHLWCWINQFPSWVWR